MHRYNPNIHHRKPIRLKGYDYSRTGWYFITICCQNRACLFGDVVNGKMILNDAGKIADECWLNIPNHFPNVKLHEHIIMPNHVHGIIEIIGTDNMVGANHHSPKPPKDHSPKTPQNNPPKTTKNNNIIRDNKAKKNSPPQSPSRTIGSIVRGFKIGVTKWMRKNTDVFDVWQRNYYDHIIRNEQSYQAISKYIINNPAKWTSDKFHKK